MSDQLLIRRAASSDLAAIALIRAQTRELHVGKSDAHMPPEELRSFINDPYGIFLVAMFGETLAGFAYASGPDPVRQPHTKAARLVYLTIIPEWRKRGFAGQLMHAVEDELKRRGVIGLYAWAASEAGGEAVSFCHHRLFALGNRFVYVEKKL